MGILHTLRFQQRIIRKSYCVTLIRSVLLAICAVIFAGCDSDVAQDNNVMNVGSSPSARSAVHPMFQFAASVNGEWRRRFVSLVDAEHNEVARETLHFDSGSIRIYTSAAGRTVAVLPPAREIVLCDVTACDAAKAFQRLLSATLQQRLLVFRHRAEDITITLRAAPAVEQLAACHGREILPVSGDQVQYVPLCWSEAQSGYESFYFYPEISNAGDTDQRLALFYLSANGCVMGLADGGLLVPAGARVSAAAGGSSLPLNQPEYMFALGVHHLPDGVFPNFNSCAEDGVLALHTLVAALEADNDSANIVAAARLFKAVSNRVLAPAAGGATPGQPREYTIKDFDIRPYLPDDRDSALYKVLYTAHTLTGSAQRDGIGYKQHDWSKPDDEANLQEGIDCSRAIWFSFTRALLPYTAREVDEAEFHTQDYIPTVSMVSENSLLSHNFQRCDDDAPRLGDVLVYRRTDADTGHVVMVIDPEQRIAWGSHGWDGNGRTPDAVPDVGAEYQLIKYKRDWQAWDRRTMTLRACWRYNDFSQVSRVDIGNSAPQACDPELKMCAPTL